MFQKLDVCLQVKRWGVPTQLGPLEIANQNHWTPPKEKDATNNY
jgi:hypothetical protein